MDKSNKTKFVLLIIFGLFISFDYIVLNEEIDENLLLLMFASWKNKTWIIKIITAFQQLNEINQNKQKRKSLSMTNANFHRNQLRSSSWIFSSKEIFLLLREERKTGNYWNNHHHHYCFVLFSIKAKKYTENQM